MFKKLLFVFQWIWYSHLTSDGRWCFTFHRRNHRECHRSSTKAGHRSHTACNLIVPVCWRFSAAVAVKCEGNVWAQNRSGVWCCCNNDKIYTWNDGLQTVHNRIWCIYLSWRARLFNNMGLKPFSMFRSSWNTGGNTPGIDWDLCKAGYLFGSCLSRFLLELVGKEMQRKFCSKIHSKSYDSVFMSLHGLDHVKLH